MLTLEDTRWKTLQGGYRIPFDASVPLRRLEEGEDVWKELWEELHHQGDVGEASYAAVPQLVRIASARERRDWHFYGLVALIEVERHRKRNPPLPSWLVEEYEQAWKDILRLALRDLTTVADADSFLSILGAGALARGQLEIGTWITDADAAAIGEELETRRGWSELFR
jgi:hypothetical protein